MYFPRTQSGRLPLAPRIPDFPNDGIIKPLIMTWISVSQDWMERIVMEVNTHAGSKRAFNLYPRYPSWWILGICLALEVFIQTRKGAGPLGNGLPLWKWFIPINLKDFKKTSAFEFRGEPSERCSQGSWLWKNLSDLFSGANMVPPNWIIRCSDQRLRVDLTT